MKFARITTVWLLAVAGMATSFSLPSNADSPNVPPPVVDSALQATITVAVRRNYRGEIFPAYLHWLASDGAPEDSLPAFTAFVATRTSVQHLRWCYIWLYVNSH
jgi:hypothetical protein